MMKHELAVQLLGMKREDCFAVVALDMDIWGYGETVEDAAINLEEHIQMQVAYLVKAEKVELLRRQAPAEYYDMYHECFIARVKGESVPGWWIANLAVSVKGADQSYRIIPHRKTISSPAARYAAGVCRRLAA